MADKNQTVSLSVPDKVNPFLREKLTKPETTAVGSASLEDMKLDFLVQVRPSEVGALGQALTEQGFDVRDPINIPDTPLAFVPTMASIDGLNLMLQSSAVEEVHYNMPVQILGFTMDSIFPAIARDPLLGKVKMNSVSQPPVTPLTQATTIASQFELPPELLTSMESMIASSPPPLPAIHKSDVDEVVPSSVVYDKVGIPEDNRVVDTKVGVLDTGALDKNHPLWRKEAHTRSFTGEAPTDMQGHGSWCQTSAFGGVGETRFGRCKGIADVKGENIYIGKVLSNIGFGSTEFILRGMGWMVENGVDVVSMSLGGEQQGPVDDDPQCQLIRETRDEVDWIVAAGNSGPDKWTVGSPGASPYALTVASYSTVSDDVADFSSRGPQGAWYKENQAKYEEDLNEYGSLLVQPDLAGYGGGPTGEQARDDIYSATQGMSDGMSDYFVDGYTPMRGTSMATPQVAGLITLLKERDLLDNVTQLKEFLQRQPALAVEPTESELEEGKDIARGHGLLEYPEQ